jgi:hypothetical protein
MLSTLSSLSSLLSALSLLTFQLAILCFWLSCLLLSYCSLLNCLHSTCCSPLSTLCNLYSHFADLMSFLSLPGLCCLSAPNSLFGAPRAFDGLSRAPPPLSLPSNRLNPPPPLLPLPSSQKEMKETFTNLKGGEVLLQSYPIHSLCPS